MVFNYNEVRFMFEQQLQHGQVPINYTFIDWLEFNFKEVAKDPNGRNYLKLSQLKMGII